jgi:arsenate reductase
MAKFIIYHNPRCSKSRQTLSILKENDIQPDIVLYLDTPPDRSELKDLLKKLGKTPREILRKSEEAYQAMQLGDESLNDDQLIDAMLKEPKLIERPIVVKGSQAVLGRPPENILEMI